MLQAAKCDPFLSGRKLTLYLRVPKTRISKRSFTPPRPQCQLYRQNGKKLQLRYLGRGFRTILGQMRIVSTGLRDVKLVQQQRHPDTRGWFAEVVNATDFEAAGLPGTFAQDNQSYSTLGVLRGLHYQVRQPQGKLVRVLQGSIWDVAVDLRRRSPDFGRWAAFELRPLSTDGTLEMLWIPAGFAHGFLVTSPFAEVLYKVTRPYDPGGERTLRWDDADLAITWPLHLVPGSAPLISTKDAAGDPLRTAEMFENL